MPGDTMAPTACTRRGGTPTRRGALVISLDFELHWGVRDKHSIRDYRENLLGVRRAVPAMLGVFAEFEVHATWATVGFLLCESKRELLGIVPARLPAYERRDFSPYEALDEIGDNELEDPYHFAPSLVRRIAETPHQEVGTHTLSHYYCLEAGQGPAEFGADLAAAMSLMRAKLGRVPKSIVFPRNQVTDTHLAVCRDAGLLAYRGNLDRWLYRARRDADESTLRRGLRLADAYLPLSGHRTSPLPADRCAAPVNVCASYYLRPYSRARRHLEALRLRRLANDLRHAAAEARLCHLWWHPHDFGRDLERNLRVLREILAAFARLRDRYGMESLTMAEAARRALAVAEPPERSAAMAGGPW